MAGEKVYARGEDYYHGGHVDLLFHDVHEAAAEVQGSHPYRVDFSLSEQGEIQADCTCPAMADWGFCKHAVATGLYLIEAPPATRKGNGKRSKEEADSFAAQYPNLAGWVKDGWIEIGRDGYSTSMIRVLDDGGLVWEGGTRHKSVAGMLKEAEEAIKDWFEEN